MENIKHGKYVIEFRELTQSKFTAKCINTRKNNLSKPVFYYSFETLEKAKHYAEKWVLKEKEKENLILKNKEEIKAKKAEAKRNLINPYKVGDILYSSWGYDQTNVDFYQIVEVMAKSIELRKIKGEFIAFHKVAPIKDAFTNSNSFTKIIQVTSNGAYYVKNKSGYYLSEYKEKQGVYCSNY